MADDLCRALDPYVDPPAPQPTIDLRRCKPGDRVRMKDGRQGRYVRNQSNPVFPHLIQRDDNSYAQFTDRGLYWETASSSYDIVEILDPTPLPNQSPTDGTLKATFLQHLYAQSGRTCGTFSGLWAEFRQHCLQEHLNALAEQLAQEKRQLWGEQRKGGES